MFWGAAFLLNAWNYHCAKDSEQGCQVCSHPRKVSSSTTVIFPGLVDSTLCLHGKQKPGTYLIFVYHAKH